jgi:hypothetical protein
MMMALGLMSGTSSLLEEVRYNCNLTVIVFHGTELVQAQQGVFWHHVSLKTQPCGLWSSRPVEGKRLGVFFSFASKMLKFIVAPRMYLKAGYPLRLCSYSALNGTTNFIPNLSSMQATRKNTGLAVGYIHESQVVALISFCQLNFSEDVSGRFPSKEQI